MPDNIAIPILPSSDLCKTAQFYEKLGFKKHFPAPDYLIVLHEEIELHFVIHQNLTPIHNESACFIRTTRIETLFETMRHADLPLTGIPRLTVPEDKPWGIREFAVVDPSGNLLRIGQILS